VEEDLSSKDETLIVLYLSADAYIFAIAFNAACANHWRSQHATIHIQEALHVLFEEVTGLLL
jgi:hypothetical protein